jgi:hypothetical protein
MAKFGDTSLRHLPLTIHANNKEYYLGLIYKPKDRKVFKIFQDIDELPTDFKREDVYPLTYIELLYSEVYKGSDHTPCLVTRYPISGYGSVYPCFVYLKTTTKSESRYELDYAWEPTDNLAQEFPIAGEQFFDTMSLSRQHLARLGADFDGDCMSQIALLTEDAYQELYTTLNNREFYVDPNNKMYFSVANDVLDLVLKSMTG